MNIDQRLDRLVGRHEALAQTVESIGLDIQQLTQKQGKTDEQIAALTKNIESMRGITNEIAHGTALLLSRSNTHDSLLEDHGKRIGKLEE